jgi:hypothetical protein
LEGAVDEASIRAVKVRRLVEGPVLIVDSLRLKLTLCERMLLGNLRSQ